MMRRALPALVLVLSFVLGTVAPVQAAPAAEEIADKEAQAAEISEQLAEQGRKISILAEEYNNARLEAERLADRLSAAKADMAKTDSEAKRLRSRLKGQAVDSYVQGGAVPALAMLVQTKLEDDIAVRHQYVESVTSMVGDTLDELRAVKLTLAEQADELSDAQRASREALAAVEASREEALAAQRAQAKLLDKVEGELAALVAAEEKRKAEEEARRVQAEMAARRAREEAAAREAAARRAAAATTTSTTTTTVRRTATTAAPVTSTTALSTTTTTAPKATEPTNAPPPSSGAAAAIEEAKRQLGKPYEWGGSGPDTYDCSGLTSWAWRAGGKSLPHSSQAQYSATSRVAFADIQPGDLLFYGDPIHHVALYIGDGQMIEAPETGKNVRYASIYRRDYTGAGRVN